MRMRLVLLSLFICSLIIIVLLVIDLAITMKLQIPKRIYCCLCLTRQNPSVQSLLLDPPADSAVDLFTKNSDTMSSKISPWSNSVHSKSENQDGSETNSL
ncbi:unnamed protein product [Hymenolepis diminuta]|nr:unnamed protein product [Hymenolepis diminuta]